MVRITVLAGGVGAARFLRGLAEVVPPESIVAVVNTGDDLEISGLHVSPDLDTVVYTLADLSDWERGWGLARETWNAMEMLRLLGREAWFSLGDRDLGTHLYRTSRLAEGADLAEVTGEICRALGVRVRVLPATTSRLRTRVGLTDGREVEFQEYFVKLAHSVPVTSVRFEGADDAEPTEGILDAISEADLVFVAPSNPIVSIAPILAVRAIDEAVRSSRHKVVAISPIIGGKAVKGPADRLLSELGYESSVVGVAGWYSPHAATLVIDETDAGLAPEVEAAGMRCVVAPTLMRDVKTAAVVARRILDCIGFGNVD
ncbi:MAG: LPPG--FO 2-phospho-L-lactate transferase [Acidimicrobiales bacterium]|nr:MAG: LPPG--FO 2-phospho-L-lactate transferase [Acidimicrobiales bacterium]